MLEYLFISSILFVSYAYFGYPLSLIMMSLFVNKKVFKRTIHPKVTIIITAFNEEKRIQEKIENTLALEYPANKLEIIIASDASTDNTDRIIQNYKYSGVILLRVNERRGKENAQMTAVKSATGEILIFTDTATLINKDGIKNIVSNFADRTIGCVSSEDCMLKEDGHKAGEGAYVKYEMWLRRLESRVNSLVGLSGSFFAARKEVCKDFSSVLQSDFRTVLNSVKLGLRGVSEQNAIGYYKNLAKDENEFDRKVRTVIRGLTVLFQHLELLNILRYGIFSYQMICHKLLRWTVPMFLIIAFFTNMILSVNSYGYMFIFVCQVLFYGFALFVKLMDWKLNHPVLKIPIYFSIVNLSILVAWYKYIRGQRIVIWAPSER